MSLLVTVMVSVGEDQSQLVQVMRGETVIPVNEPSATADAVDNVDLAQAKLDSLLAEVQKEANNQITQLRTVLEKIGGI